MIQTTIAQQPKGSVQATALPVQQKAKDQPIKAIQPKQEMGAAVQQPAQPVPAAQEMQKNTPQPMAAQASAAPSEKAMVENRVAGLLDPSNALMRKAVAQAQGYSASRGLQSSSIGNEVALSTMVDKAQGIASQDANTWAQFERDNATHNNQVGLLQMQQQFQSGESALNRDHESTLVDKQAGVQKELAALQNKYALGQLDAQGQQRMNELQAQQQFQQQESSIGRDFQKEMQELQYKQQQGILDLQGQQRMAELTKQAEFQSIENATSREFQQKMQELQHQQNLGTLDVQGKQQLQQMERNAQLTTQRDSILQQYQKELNTQQNQQRITEIDRELNARKDLLRTELDARTYSEYNNAVSTGYNNMLAQMGAVYSNPNMTPEQQASGVAKITEMFKAQQAQLETLYGLTKPTSSTPPATGVKPTNPTIPSPETPTQDRSVSGQQLFNGSPVQNVGAPVTQRYLER